MTIVFVVSFSFFIPFVDVIFFFSSFMPCCSVRITNNSIWLVLLLFVWLWVTLRLTIKHIYTHTMARSFRLKSQIFHPIVHITPLYDCNVTRTTTKPQYTSRVFWYVVFYFPPFLRTHNANVVSLCKITAVCALWGLPQHILCSVDVDKKKKRNILWSFALIESSRRRKIE